jgi:hypothetical protein
VTAPGTACPSANEGVCTGRSRQLAHNEQLRQENAALKERIEQPEWER